MEVFLSYFKRQLGRIAFGLIVIGIFFLTLYLYGVPLEPALYAAVLAIAFGVVCYGYGFVRFARRHRRVLSARKQLAVQLPEFPQPRDIIEKDYQEMIEALFSDLTKKITEVENERSELLEYYTLWVHQIKTPISAMKLLLEEEDSELNTELSLELFKIERYVEMVLNYLRIESPSSDFVFKKHDLAELVKQAIRKYARMFVKKKIRLNLQEFQCEVLTDEKWLVFVLEQVISNAIKYTDEGTVSIYLASSERKELMIEDTGIGIAAEDLPRVFDKGYTGYAGRLDKRATGIGLYLSKKILTKLSHTIGIESTPGKGTRVKIGLETVSPEVRD